MGKNNGGFTLVELIICMLIFSIVVAAAFGLMLTGSKTYGSVTERLNLDVQSQLAINQLDNYLIDCNAGIYFNDISNTLFIINKDNGSYTVNVIKYGADHCLYYGKGQATPTGENQYSCTVDASDLISDNVTNFDIDLNRSIDGTTAYSAEITLGFAKGGASGSFKNVTALRNKPAIVSVQVN